MKKLYYFFGTLIFPFLINISQVKAQATLNFVSIDSTALESSASATMYVKVTASSPASCAITISTSPLSNASASDYTLSTTQVTFAANAPINSTAAVVILINNDALIESDEYVVLKLVNGVNANTGSSNQCNFYIKDNDKPVPAATNALTLNLLTSFTNGVSGSNSAEIVVHDPSTQRLYIANSIGAKLDIVDFANPSSPSLLSSISVTPYGNINSVAVRNGTVAAAMENTNPQDSGRIVFFNKDGVFLKQVKTGMMPDMITFNHAGTKVITANEGEPNQAYTVDPDGSISIVDISGGIPALTQNNVSHVTFTVYNGQENSLRAQGIRIYGQGASASKDLEPEYVAVSKDDSRAYVTLQENNAFVEINLTNNSIVAIRALGSKSHSLAINSLDASNQTKGVNMSAFPIKGLYLPDAVATYTVGGVNYIVTANEGDARAYSGFSEEARISAGAVVLDPVKFPQATEIKNSSFLGRLNITTKLGDTDNDGDLDTIFCYGSRSFSIWNASTGVQVYDSKDDFETITSTNSFSVMFNASNTLGVPTKKDRSDDKGPEPEGVTIGTIGANTYAFIALERIGGVMVYDITNPNSPVYVTYVNNVNPLTGSPDRGAEGLIFIPQSQSPNGQHIIIAANEVSSSLSIWGIPGCASPIATSLSISGNTVACSNAGPVLSVPSATGVTYQWYNVMSPVSGATSNTFSPSFSGDFYVTISGGAGCSASSLSRSITINAAPALSVAPSTTLLCKGETATLTASGATSSYSWSTGDNTASTSVSPTSTAVYTLTGVNSNSCTAIIVYTLNVADCVGLSEFSGNNGTVILSPNPSNDYFTVSFNSTENIKLNIINATGKIVYSDASYTSGNKIDVSLFSKGIYFVQLSTEKETVNRRLIVN